LRRRVKPLKSVPLALDPRFRGGDDPTQLDTALALHPASVQPLGHTVGRFLDKTRQLAQFAGHFRRHAGEGADLVGFLMQKSNRVAHAALTALATLPVPNFLLLGFGSLLLEFADPQTQLLFDDFGPSAVEHLPALLCQAKKKRCTHSA
jgi:hypothetical protein